MSKVIDLDPTNQARLFYSTSQAVSLTDLTGWGMPIRLADMGAASLIQGSGVRQQAETGGVLPLLIFPAGETLSEAVISTLLSWHCPVLLFAGSIGASRSRLLEKGITIVDGLDITLAEQIRPGDWLLVTPLTADPIDSPCRVIAIRNMRPPWFEVEELADGIYALTEPGHHEYVRSFLVIGQREAALIDTGMGIDPIRPLVESLTRLPVRVLLTHAHWDHIGSVHQFERVAIHEAEAAALAQGAPHGSERLAGLREQLRAKFVGRPWPPYFEPNRYALPGFSQPDLLRDGDRIDLGGRILEVIHTPGHSPGSICFFDRERRQLFIGDVFYYGPLYCEDFAAYLASTRRLAAMADQVDLVFPSHNELALFGRPMNGQDLRNLRAGFERIERGEIADGAMPQFELAESGFAVLMGFPY